MRRELPTGTVTFLFTDVEGSTRLLQELGDEGYAVALADHRRRLRDAFAAHGGVEVDTQGDAFFYAFADAERAVAAAADGHDALAAGPIRVRVGLHTGTPLVTGEGYVGEDVHEAARIGAAGHGGQVLASASTRDQAPARQWRDLGEHRLKDLKDPVWLYQLGPGDFPPLKTVGNTNLPAEAASFVGRRAELDDLGALLEREDVRLLTLTGPGGVGKTRLALRLALEATGAFPNGVFLVALAAVTRPELVLPAVAKTLGIEERPGEAVGDSLARRLEARTTLLVLDNFEHVLEAALELSELLRRVPKLKIATTSRERLNLQAERVYRVEPLPEEDAVTLFAERALAADGSFAVDDRRPIAAAICRRLDGLPLAIELAAARAPLLGLDDLLAQLDVRLAVLEGGARDLHQRHRTLRATIAWSHDLLGAAEQTLLRRLGVFVDGWPASAVADVTGASAAAVEPLAHKSLVRVASGRGGMLETVREFALDQLERAGETEQMRSRHAAHFLERAHTDRDRLDELARDDANFRAAVTWLTEHDPAGALHINLALESYWKLRDTSAELVRDTVGKIERAARALGDAEPALRARALALAADAHVMFGEADLARALLGEALLLARAAGDAEAAGNTLLRLDRFAEARDVFRAAGDAAGESRALVALAWDAADRGEREDAEALYEDAVALGFGGDGGAQPTWDRAALAYRMGRTDEADRLYAEAAAMWAALGSDRLLMALAADWATTKIERGDPEGARLLGAASAAEERLGLPIAPYDQERYVALRARVETSDDFQAGRRLTLDEALGLA